MPKLLGTAILVIHIYSFCSYGISLFFFNKNNINYENIYVLLLEVIALKRYFTPTYQRTILEPHNQTKFSVIHRTPFTLRWCLARAVRSTVIRPQVLFNNQIFKTNGQIDRIRKI